MNLKKIIYVAIIAFSIGNYVFFMKAMEDKESRTKEIQHDNCQKLTDLVLAFYEKSDAESLNIHLLRFSSNTLITVFDNIASLGHKKLIFNVLHHRVMNEDEISREGNTNIIFNIYLVTLLLERYDVLDFDERRVLDESWRELVEDINRVYENDKRQLDSSAVLDLKSKELIKIFRIYQPQQVGRFYDSHYKNRINEVCENDEELLKKILMYVFLHFEEYQVEANEAIELIEFLFPEKKDSGGIDIVNLSLNTLSKHYPVFASFMEHFILTSDIRHKILKLMIALKSFAKE